MGVGKRMKSTLVGCNSMFTSWLVRNLTWHKVLYIYRLQYIVSISPGEWNKNSLRTAPECWWKLPTIETTSLLPRTAWKLMTEASASSSSGNRNTTSTGYSFLCYSTLTLIYCSVQKVWKIRGFKYRAYVHLPIQYKYIPPPLANRANNLTNKTVNALDFFPCYNAFNE